MKLHFNGSKLKRFQSSLRKDIENFKKEQKLLVARTTAVWDNTAKELAPSDTGYLRRNLTFTPPRIRNGIIKSNVESGAEYSVYVEFGTGDTGMATNKNTKETVTYTKGFKGQKAQPFFYPAVYKAEEYFNKEVKESIKKFGKG